MSYKKNSILSEDGWETFMVCTICHEKINVKEKTKHMTKCEEEFMKDKLSMVQKYE